MPPFARGLISMGLFAFHEFPPGVAALPLPALAGRSSISSQSRLVAVRSDGALVYSAFNARGDVLPDFSHCGYGGGGVPIPELPVREALWPEEGGDDTARVQAALDRVSARPADCRGLRGAVLLNRGTWRVGGVLEIRASGVVLRGAGSGDDGTHLLATAMRQQTVVCIRGNSGPEVDGSGRSEIADDVVPVGARSFTVEESHGFAVGQLVYVVRRGNAAWITEIGMDRISGRPANPASTRQWEPFDLKFDRVITAIEGRRVTVDAPIVCAIERQWGGGELVTYDDPGRIEHCGVENLRATSLFDRSKTGEHRGERVFVDENHASYLVTFEAAKNCWARDVVTVHFWHGPARIAGNAKWITVEDARSLQPVSIITGGRRYPYSIDGQLVLIRRCYSDGARHAFVLGARVPGPNVFLDCRSERDFGSSEPHHRWSVGGLFDNVEAVIAFQDRQYMGSGHGWSGANYVAWNCRGSLICQQPPTAQNFAVGFVGKRGVDAFPGRPAGWWESEGTPVAPRSLYEAQLRARGFEP